jgi:hypothetical protein
MRNWTAEFEAAYQARLDRQAEQWRTSSPAEIAEEIMPCSNGTTEVLKDLMQAVPPEKRCSLLQELRRQCYLDDHPMLQTLRACIKAHDEPAELCCG